MRMLILILILLTGVETRAFSPFFPVEPSNIMTFQRNERIGFSSPTLTTIIMYSDFKMLDDSRFSRLKTDSSLQPLIDTCVFSSLTVACSDSDIYHVPIPPFLNSVPNPVVSNWAGSLQTFYFGESDSFCIYDSMVMNGAASKERLTEVYQAGVGLIYRIHSNYDRIFPEKMYSIEENIISVMGVPVNGKTIYDSLVNNYQTKVRKNYKEHPIFMDSRKVDVLGRLKLRQTHHRFFGLIANSILN